MRPSLGWPGDRVGRVAGRIRSVELGRDRLRVGAERAQPVDDEAAQPGVGAVPQQGPDFLGMTQPNQGDRRPRLTLGQSSLTSSSTTGRCQTEAVTGGPSGVVRATDSETGR